MIFFLNRKCYFWKSRLKKFTLVNWWIPIDAFLFFLCVPQETQYFSITVLVKPMSDPLHQLRPQWNVLTQQQQDMLLWLRENLESTNISTSQHNSEGKKGIKSTEFHGEENIRSTTCKVLSLIVQWEDVAHLTPHSAPRPQSPEAPYL